MVIIFMAYSGICDICGLREAPHESGLLEEEERQLTDAEKKLFYDKHHPYIPKDPVDEICEYLLDSRIYKTSWWGGELASEFMRKYYPNVEIEDIGDINPLKIQENLEEFMSTKDLRKIL